MSLEGRARSWLIEASACPPRGHITTHRGSVAIVHAAARPLRRPGQLPGTCPGATEAPRREGPAVTATSAPDLAGQRVVVIGGSSGIGLETARHARSQGADLIL